MRLELEIAAFDFWSNFVSMLRLCEKTSAASLLGNQRPQAPPWDWISPGTPGSLLMCFQRMLCSRSGAWVLGYWNFWFVFWSIVFVLWVALVSDFILELSSFIHNIFMHNSFIRFKNKSSCIILQKEFLGALGPYPLWPVPIGAWIRSLGENSN